MADYARLLLRRFVVSQFTKEGKKIHVIFDNPGQLQNTLNKSDGIEPQRYQQITHVMKLLAPQYYHIRNGEKF